MPKTLIDMSALLKKIEVFDMEAVRPLLSEQDDLAVCKALRRFFSSPKIFNKLSPSPQKKRDKFLQDLTTELRHARLSESVSLIEEKLEIIATTETLFKAIRAALVKSPSAQYSAEEQVWSHIQRAEIEAKMVADDTKRKRESFISGTPFVMSGSMQVTAEEGHQYNPDGALRKIVDSLSLTLAMLSHELKLNDAEGRSCFPSRPQLSEAHTYAAGTTQVLAIAWDSLEEASYRGMVFGASVTSSVVDSGDNCVSVHTIQRQFAPFEFIELFAHDRHNYKLAQNFSEIYLEIRQHTFPLISEVGPIDNGKMLSIHEVAATWALDDAYCFDVRKHTTRYAGLRLAEWIRGYSILRYIAEHFIPSGGASVYSEAELVAELTEGGLSRTSALNFIRLVTFGKGSRDLFDTPLIRLAEGNYYFFAPAMTSAQIVNVLLSRLSSLEVQVDKKGRALETRFRKLLTKIGLDNRSFKFKEGNDQYEYDNVFIFGKRVFVVECKNRGLWMHDAVACFRKFEDLEETIIQVKRLSEGLVKHPEHFSRQFGLDLSDFEVVPVILNAMPISYPGMYDGVYITDLSAFGRFFKSREITMEALGTDRKVSAHQLWRGDKPTDDDLIEQFSNPVQLIRYSDYLKNRESYYPIWTDIAFVTNHLEIEHAEMNEDYVKDYLAASREDAVQT